MYVFGTMHLAAEGFLEQNTYIQKALTASDIIYTEANLNQNEIGTAMVKYIFMPEGVKLSDSLSPTEWKQLDSLLTKFNNPAISAASLNTCKPMYVLALISSAAFTNTDSASKNTLEGSVDFAVVQLAKQKHKNLRYFETAEQQLQYLFNDPPLDLQFRLLKNSLRTISEGDSFAKLAANLPLYYKQQNLDTIALIMQHANMGDKDMQLIYQNLLDSRNERWIATIEHLVSIGRNSAFIAVGAGHLIGDKGLLNLLRQKGYIVEPIME